MGNLEAVCHAENMNEAPPTPNESESRIIAQPDFASWGEGQRHLVFDFPAPCMDQHNDNYQYNIHSCYSLEVNFGRRRSVQFRRNMTRYSAELERFADGHHSLHVRDLGGLEGAGACSCSSGHTTVISLVKASTHVPELDYMYNPILTVIAYHRQVLVITVQEKTKTIPKLLLFIDVNRGEELGAFVAQLDYSNLSGVRIDCAINDDASIFVIYFLEDHYDAFHAHFHAICFDTDGKPRTIANERILTPMWYDTGLHLAFLPRTNKGKCNTSGTVREYIVILCERQGNGDIFRIPGTEPTRCLIVYDLYLGQIVKAVELTDKLYPVYMNVSPDAGWIATLSRIPTEWPHACGSKQYEDRSVEDYVTKLYSSDTLNLLMQVHTPLTTEVFNALPHCNKIMFSQSSKLLVLPSCGQVEEEFVDYEFGSYVVSTATRDIHKMTMSVYRLPVVDVSLKALCRDSILNYCAFEKLADLPLPNSITDYLHYKN